MHCKVSVLQAAVKEILQVETLCVTAFRRLHKDGWVLPRADGPAYLTCSMLGMESDCLAGLWQYDFVAIWPQD